METQTRTQHTLFREDRQFGEPFAPNEQVYRTIDLSSEQLDRLPMWARLAIARADAAIIQRNNTITNLLAACELMEQADTQADRSLAWLAMRSAIARARGDA